MRSIHLLLPEASENERTRKLKAHGCSPDKESAIHFQC